MDGPVTPRDPATAPPPELPAGRVWPRFTARREEIAPERFRVYFVCAACGMTDVLDDETSLCRSCWRPFKALAEALVEMRNEMRKEAP